MGNRINAKEKIVSALVASEQQRQWFSKPLFGTIAYQDFVDLEQLLRNRDGINMPIDPEGGNAIRGLLALGNDLLGNYDKKRSEQYDHWSTQLVAAIHQSKLYRHLSATIGFKKATREFTRLSKIGQHAEYSSPFAQLQFLQCIVSHWGHYAMLQSTNVIPKRPLAKEKASAIATAKKLLTFMEKRGVALPDIIKSINLREALADLIAELKKPQRAERADGKTNGRNALRAFTKSYFEAFGHRSPSISIAFASIIGHDVSKENIVTHLRTDDAETGMHTPQTYFYKGGMQIGKNLPFPMVMVFGKK